METLKFLMITTHFPPNHLGGDAVFVDYLSRELSRRGHEVHVLHSPATYELLRSVNKSALDTASDGGVHRHPYRSQLGKFEPMMTLTLGVCGGAKRRIIDVGRMVNPDVVHWHNTRGFVGVPFILGNETSLYTSHDYGSVCPRSNLLRPGSRICTEAKLCTLCTIAWRKPPQVWRASQRRVVKFPDTLRIIAPSKFVAERLSMEGVTVHHVLRNFVPEPGKTAEDWRGDRDSIVYVGMLEAHKGLETLINGFIRSAGHHGFRLDVIGEGSLKHNLVRLSAQSQFASRINIHGFLSREHAEELRRRAVAQVVPSEWLENCPLTIIEALAMGIPVIGSDIGGIPEILTPESGSKVFPAGNVNALSDTVVDAWRHRHIYDESRKRPRETYEARFTPNVHIRGYMKILNYSD